MKMTITTIATAFLMMLSFNSFTIAKINPLKNLSSSKIVMTYLEATTLGSSELNRYLFADDFQYLNAGDGRSYGKRQYMKFLKANTGLKYDCETNYEILDECGKACVAKITMKFKNFIRVDYVTLNQRDDSWEVSKVVTTYP